MTRKRIGRRLRTLRSRHGWTQEVLAHISGLNRSYIGSIERAEHNIGVDNLERIAAAFGVPVEALLSESEIESLGASVALGVRRFAHERRSTEDVCTTRIDKETFERLFEHSQGHPPDMLLQYLQGCGIEVAE